MRWEPQMSARQVITQVPWDCPAWETCLDVVDLSAHGSPCSSPLCFYPPSPFLWPSQEDDACGSHDLSLKCCVAHNLSYIANTQKLSADWQSTHYLLNLSACVILSDAFAPKKSLLTVTAVSAAIFLQEEKNENQFSGRQCFDNISLMTLLRIPSKFQSLSMILKMTWIYFSLKRRSVS